MNTLRADIVPRITAHTNMLDDLLGPLTIEDRHCGDKNHLKPHDVDRSQASYWIHGAVVDDPGTKADQKLE